MEIPQVRGFPSGAETKPAGSGPAAHRKQAPAMGMNASELMYYCAAPLAHIVDYETHMRARLRQDSIHRSRRCNRSRTLRPRTVAGSGRR
jgi:hypothetical protein